jgi:hypothetical protein
LFNGIDFIIYYGLGHHGIPTYTLKEPFGWTLLHGNLLLKCARFNILSGVAEDFGLLGCCVVSLSKWFPTF